MKCKLCLIIISLVMTLTQSYALETHCDKEGPCPVVPSVSEPCYCYSVIEKAHKERIALYNALALTDEQKEAASVIEKEREGILLEKAFVLCRENQKLTQLRYEKAGRLTIKKQELNVKNLKNEIDKICEEFDKKFISILTRDQHAKYNMIHTLEKRDFKKDLKGEAFKSDLKPFGCKISQPDFSQYKKEENSILHKLRFKHL